MDGKSGSEIAGGAMVNLIGGKVGLAADLLKVGKNTARGVNSAFWAMEVGAGEVM
ncbi:hypothetical protein ACIO3O_35650 [Streptomyces sp. NPDC087440]|uniref:hypothetical protein n=1 Tax=Streptomyces sp. NPDC087440 TaxID=3365790 RepID=UPI0037FBC39A